MGFGYRSRISAPSFFAWKKRLKEAATESFVRVRVAEPAHTAQAVATPSPAIEIRLGGVRSILVPPGFDADHLRAVLSVLEPRA